MLHPFPGEVPGYGPSVEGTAESLGRDVRRHGGQPLPGDPLRLERLEGQPGRRQGPPGRFADVGAGRGVDLPDRRAGDLGVCGLRDSSSPW